MIKVMSLFSGVEGLGHRLNRNQFEIVGLSEIDKHASNKLRKEFPSIKNFGDVTKIQSNDLPDFDLLTFGFPCQSFSISGKRLGFEDTRGTLFFEAARIIDERKPKYIMFENVKGLTNHDGGRTLEVILEKLSSLGYLLDFEIVNAKYFGIPQNRERIFCFGIRGDLIHECRSETVQFYNKVKKEASRKSENQSDSTWNIIDKLSAYSTANYAIRDVRRRAILCQTDCGSENPERERISGEIGHTENAKIGKEISYCLDSNYRKGTNTVLKGRRQLVMDGCLVHYGHSNKDHDFMEISPCLKAEAHGHLPKVVAYSKSTRSDHVDHRIKIDIEANTLSTGDGCSNQSTANFIVEPLEINDIRIRKLTPLECERLMGWRDNYTLFAANDDGAEFRQSDSQRYRQCGNGIVSTVSKEIIESFFFQLGIFNKEAKLKEAK
jgi:DNA-cytosine methyltransferase